MRGFVFLALMLAMGIGPARADEVAIANSVIYPGQRIESGNIRVIKTKQSAPAEMRVARSAAEIVGLVAAHTILPNRMISLDAVREADVVEPGKEVRAIYRSGSLSIVLRATALTAGAPGDIIKLRNTKSGRTFDGFVAADGSVVVK